MKTTAALMAAIFAAACAATNGIDFVECFGPQETGSVQEGRLEEYEVKVWVGPGSQLKLSESGNPTVTLVDGRPQRGAVPSIDPARTYVHATLRLNADLGWRIYTCSVRVREGPLDGAVIAVCDGEVPPKIKDPYQAVYALPPDVHLEPQELRCDVVEFWGK